MAEGGELAGKTAIVTGGAGGIGQAVAEAFLDEGAAVILADFRPEVGAEAEAVLGEGGREDQVRFLQTDVTDRESVAAMVEDTKGVFGGVHVVANIAGNVDNKKLLGQPDELWDRTIGIHLTGTRNVSQLAAREMKAQGEGGSIINTASISAWYGNEGQTAYTAAKAGIIGLTKTMVRELAKYSIRANVVLPGATDTEMLASVDEIGRKLMVAATPMGRLAMTSEVAEAFLFFASDRSSFVTGAQLNVDGGLVIPQLDQGMVVETVGDLLKLGGWKDPDEVAEAIKSASAVDDGGRLG